MTTDQIAKEIQSLIDSEVRKQTPETKWKEYYQEVMSELSNELGQAEAIIEEFTDENLTLNAVEQEGYRRCLKYMVEKFNRWETYEELD